MIYDLHSHSDRSDGILSPQALMSRARAQGVSVLALTDHDTVAGLAVARQAAAVEGVTLIDGIEFSSQWGKGGVHIVGLGIDPACAVLQEAIARQQRARDERAQAIAGRLAKMGVNEPLAGARNLAGGPAVGRPHFARLLVEQGFVRDVSAAFKRYLGSGKSADVAYRWPPLEEVVAWIHAAGGLAVLAHPAKYKLTRTRLRGLVAAFAEAGGDALEVISGQQAPGLASELASLAERYGLAASCGSDFHSPDQPWQELGHFGTMPDHCRPVWQLPGFPAVPVQTTPVQTT